MIILAFDTSVTGCAVCVHKNGQDWVETFATERGQAEFLVPMIEKVMQQAEISYQDIDRIAVTVGPGSFTGVRIGLSTAKALALTLDRPLLGFNTLDVIAYGVVEKTLILIDTKRGDYYGQISGEGDQAKIWSSDDIEQNILPTIKDRAPDVRILAAMAAEAKADSAYHPEAAPKPLYLRGAEVSQSKRIAPQIIKTLTNETE